MLSLPFLELRQEWCTMSVQPAVINLCEIDSTAKAVQQNRRQNFYTVASTATSDHRLYSRDLDFLLSLSMNLEDFDLALDLGKSPSQSSSLACLFLREKTDGDFLRNQLKETLGLLFFLAGEIIDDPKRATDKKALSNVLSHLRAVAKASLNTGSPGEPKNMDVPRLRRIIRLFHNMASKPQPFPQSIVVSDELYSFFLYCRSSGDTEDPTDKEMALIDLLANNAAPKYFLQMLVEWTRAFRMPSYATPFVHRTLLRGAQRGVHQELSGSLLRIKDARQHATVDGEQHAVSSSDSSVDEPLSPHGSIWSRMRVGEAVIGK